MMIQSILELTSPPVVGRKYLVPCIELGVNRRIKEAWWPVTGPPHSDPDLGVEAMHLHYDARFLTTAAAASIMELFAVARKREVGRRPIVDAAYLRCVEGAELLVYVQRLMESELPEPPLRMFERRCEREAVAFPELWFTPKFEGQFAEARVKPDCRTCPHRGMPLASQPVDAEGGIVCSGHGLRWHKDTGRLMPGRASAAAAVGHKEMVG